MIYGKEAEKSEPAPFTAYDDKFLFSMGITPFVLSEMDGATFGEHAE